MYKKAFDDGLRKGTEDVKTGDEVYLRTERKDNTETHHKLAPITEVPFLGKKIYKKAKKFLLERSEKTVEKGLEAAFYWLRKGPLARNC